MINKSKCIPKNNNSLFLWPTDKNEVLHDEQSFYHGNSTNFKGYMARSQGLVEALMKKQERHQVAVATGSVCVKM